MSRCTKVLHPTKVSADSHAGMLVARGYEKAESYKCRHCPFWHVTKGQKNLLRKSPGKKRGARGGDNRPLKRRAARQLIDGRGEE